MVSLSILLLVGFRMQIEKLRTEIEKFGLDNLLVIETITPSDITSGISSDRFRSLQDHGKLFTIRKMLASARSNNGNIASVVAYDDSDLRGLLPYLKYGYDTFVLSNDMPEGLLVDYSLQGYDCSAVALRPEEKLNQLMQGDTLVLPISTIPEISKNGYSMIYYLEKAKSAPPIAKITKAIQSVIQADGNGKVDIKNAELIKQRMLQLEAQQDTMRLWLALILGASLALIYGVLSVLEFRQSMYITALLKSFGVSRLLLGYRSIVENLIIVNAVTLLVIHLLSRHHDTIFKALKVRTTSDLESLYWGQETLWIIVAANLGVLISSLPVFWALRKPVGVVLD